MTLKIEDIKVRGYERVIHATNETTKLDCVIAIHNTKLGPALGGVRSWKYGSFERFCMILQDSARFHKILQQSSRFCNII